MRVFFVGRGSLLPVGTLRSESHHLLQLAAQYPWKVIERVTNHAPQPPRWIHHRL
jgi:hypothetical protein